jgi:small-conductance mechanosensitive channel
VTPFTDLEWGAVTGWLRGHGLLILVVLGLAVLISWLSGVVIRRTRLRLEEASTAVETASRQRQATLGRVATNAARVVIWAIAIAVILTSLDVELAPVLTGAGLASLAIAFGAQHFIHDVVNGVFILVENQYDVGDRVTLRIEGGLEAEGWVRSVTFRSTELEIDGGMTETVSNGKIVSALNASRGRGRLELEIRVPDGVDADRVRQELDAVLREVREDRRVARTFYSAPDLDKRKGEREELDTIRVETRPERRDEVERALRRKLDDRLRGIDEELRVERPESEAV